MDKLIGNVLYGQSGGPTSVINASAYGVITETLKHKDVIPEIYVMHHGIQGALNEEFYHMSKQDQEQINLLPHTPGSAFGTVRYKMLDFREDETDYIRLLYIFNKYNIRYFLFNGGNDSMDTCFKIADYMKHVGYDIRVIGIPKTIDNDLPYTDHTPGFGSAAKYVACTIQEVAYDMIAYPKGKVTIVEIMGRHAGWLTAAASLASLSGHGPDLIYLPEVPFSIEKFKNDVRRVYGENRQCLVAVSEGLKDESGILIGSSSGLRDAFGHFQLGGVSSKLSNILNSEMRISSRTIELGTTQRSASHLQSLTDVNEAIEVGRKAVEYALAGEHGMMITIERKKDEDYKVNYGKRPLKDIANVERIIPKEMINEDGNGVTEAFIKYALPLIEGHNAPKFIQGMQKFAHFEKN
jgi:6-phosphofructokinase 1